jgi:effector-binding domain-containing protein
VLLKRRASKKRLLIEFYSPNPARRLSQGVCRHEEALVLDTPKIVQTDDQPVAYIHLTIPREEIQSVMGPAIGEVMGAVAAQGVAIAGPWLTYHLKMSPEVFDFHVCVPVALPVTPVGRVNAGQLPASKVIQTVYQGPYEGLGDAWGEFMGWIAAQGLAPREDLWERYLVGPESEPNPASWRTELNRPLME